MGAGTCDGTEPAGRGQIVKSGCGRGGEGSLGLAVDASARRKDYLAAAEIAALLYAAKAGRHGARDHLLMLTTYRHGLCVSEVVDLRREEIDLGRSRLWVRRLKGGLSVRHPVGGDELRAIRRHLATRSDTLPWLFVSERGQPLTRQSMNCLLAAAAQGAGLLPVRPHMLRHSCGYALANKGGFSASCDLRDCPRTADAPRRRTTPAPRARARRTRAAQHGHRRPGPIGGSAGRPRRRGSPVCPRGRAPLKGDRADATPARRRPAPPPRGPRPAHGQPPSTAKKPPVHMRAWSEARNSAIAAQSSGSTRPARV